MTSTYKINERGTTWQYNEKGQFHREDGPAIEWADGTKEWWLRGLSHREDGPAIEWADGDKAWCLNGQKYTFKDYCNELLKRKLITEDKLVLFKIKHI